MFTISMKCYIYPYNRNTAIKVKQWNLCIQIFLFLRGPTQRPKMNIKTEILDTLFFHIYKIGINLHTENQCTNMLLYYDEKPYRLVLSRQLTHSLQKKGYFSEFSFKIVGCLHLVYFIYVIQSP